VPVPWIYPKSDTTLAPPFLKVEKVNYIPNDVKSFKTGTGIWSLVIAL
jgi:hypothetical protein